MKVWFVGAGPGDPELLTVKAKRLVESAACCIYAGSLVAPTITGLLPPSAERHDSARMSLPEITAVMVAAAERGVDVVRLHTGEPSIYGAIAEQMTELDRLGLEYEVVPGISSFQAAAAALKAELTAPEVAQTIILSRAAGRTPVPERENLAALSAIGGTLCLFLSVDRIADVAAAALPFYGPDCPAATVYHASWPDELVVRGTLADIADKTGAAGIRKTALILIGPALERGTGAASKLYDPAFAHGWRGGAAGE